MEKYEKLLKARQAVQNLNHRRSAATWPPSAAPIHAPKARVCSRTHSAKRNQSTPSTPIRAKARSTPKRHALSCALKGARVKQFAGYAPARRQGVAPPAPTALGVKTPHISVTVLGKIPKRVGSGLASVLNPAAKLPERPQARFSAPDHSWASSTSVWCSDARAEVPELP